jgi:predicted Ser/Thr protein kinase
MDNNEEVKKSIGAWKKQTSKGFVINFTIDGKRYSMWENQYKKEDRHPDFKIIEDTFVMKAVQTEQKELSKDDLPF